MIYKKIICDRCNKVCLDTEKDHNDETAESVIRGMYYDLNGIPGYVEMNIFNGNFKQTKTLHFCGECYEIAVKAWNDKTEEIIME